MPLAESWSVAKAAGSLGASPASGPTLHAARATGRFPAYMNVLAADCSTVPGAKRLTG